MIPIKGASEVAIIKENALIISATLSEVAKLLKPGVTTISIDTMAEQYIRDNGGVPSFKGYGGKNPFPYSLCISINDEVVHGFPSDRTVQEGDIVTFDCGVYKNGFHADHAYTFAVGEVAEDVSKLLAVTKKSLALAVEQAKANNRVGDISFAVENFCYRKHGMGVVRDLVGHGVGKNLHEDPQVPNYGKRGDGKRLKEGMVLAIEPMINLGTHKVFTDDDGWTIKTLDGKQAAHFEHTTLVGKNSGIPLSNFTPIEDAIRANANLSAAFLDLEV